MLGLLQNNNPWLVAFFFIVAALILTVLIFLFTSLGKNVHPLKTSHALPLPDSLAFLSTLSLITGASYHAGGRTDITDYITKGDAFFEKIIEDIDGARETVELMAFIWETDETTEKLGAACVRAIKRGVKVRVLLDAIGSRLFKGEQVESLRREGVQVEFFRRVVPGKYLLAFARTHRRSCVIDYEIGYTGGMAFSQKWSESLFKEKAFADLMIRIKGEGVYLLRSAFAVPWASVTGEVLLDKKPVRDESLPARNYLHLSSSPAIDIHPLSYALWACLASARTNITIASPYFIPGKNLTEILCAKAREGVPVILYLQKYTDSRIVRYASHSYYQTLLDAGVRIFEYDKQILHTKALVIDEVLTVVGSPNLDIRSCRINDENIMVFQDRDIAAAVGRILESYKEGSQEITKAEWAKRPYYKTALSHLLNQFSEQF